MNQQLDELFLKRARERGLLSVSQIDSIRTELQSRHEAEPELGASELAVENGWLGVEAALALLDAKPSDTVADLTSRISEDQLFYLQSRGIDNEQAISMLVHGFAEKVLEKLPMEFSEEAVNLLQLKLEGSVG